MAIPMQLDVEVQCAECRMQNAEYGIAFMGSVRASHEPRSATGVPPSRQRVDCVRFSAALALPVAPRRQSGDESPHSRRWRDDERPVRFMAPMRVRMEVEASHEPSRKSARSPTIHT